jgi:hypothetical protein
MQYKCHAARSDAKALAQVPKLGHMAQLVQETKLMHNIWTVLPVSPFTAACVRLYLMQT